MLSLSLRSHGAVSRQYVAVALCAGLTQSSREMRSLASEETAEKCSEGNEKSQRRMLCVVSSSESSRNGDRPLKGHKYYIK